LRKVEVYFADTKHRAVTDAAGRFSIPDVAPGAYLLVATTVGFGLVKKEIRISDGDREAEIEVEIFLSAGTQLVEEVTVTADAGGASPELTGAEIHQLKSVLADDPLRALQQLPAIVASDDFSSGFAVQGSGFDRVGVLFDGIPIYSFLHTSEGGRETGSISLLSAELIEGMDLVAGGTSAEYGGSSAGFLKLRGRTGNPSRWRSLVSVSGSAFLGLSEGPVKNGSWLGSFRRSYIDWIVRRIDPKAKLNFGFYDFYGKLLQNWGAKHSVAVSFVHGNTSREEVPENLGMNSIYQGRFVSDLAHLEWTWLAGDRLTAGTHFYWQRGDSLDRNKENRVIWENDQHIVGVRSVWDYRLPNQWTLSGGVTAESWKGGNYQQRYDSKTRKWLSLTDFDTGVSRGEAFFQGRAQIGRMLTASGGCSWNYLTPLSGVEASPFAGLEFTPTSRQLWTLSAGAAQQSPFLTQLFGEYGNPALHAETARALQGAWLYRLDQGVEVRLSGFVRRRSGVPWRRDGQWRIVEGKITSPSTYPFANILADRSVGADIQVTRRAVNGLSGWIGYAWGHSDWAETPGQWFPGSFDQRHAVSLFLQYRWSSQLDLSVKWKYAGGLPIPAYVVQRGHDYYLTEHRNFTRLPDYNRIDFRGAKSFNKDRYRITLFVEIMNLANRDNVRFMGIDNDTVNAGTGRVRDLVHTQIPIVPTAGVAVEF
jgi:hypothetical protein